MSRTFYYFGNRSPEIPPELTVYHACRQALATGLGIEPSAELEALHSALKKSRH